jgi:hypothetical protein
MANQLLEAAAEILANSKKSAPSDSPKKPEGEVQDLGGDTPQKHVDSNVKNATGTKAQAPTTKPSAASSKMEEEELDGEVVAEDKINVSDDIDAMFGDENISEEFKSKVSTIFEARVTDRINTIKEEIEAEYSSMLEEAVESIRTDLTEKVNDYLDYIVEEWMKQNEVAIEKGLRTEMVEDFIGGLRNLFAEHYIDVPAEKVDLVDELATKVEGLEDKLNEEIQRGIEYKKQLTEAKKIEVVRTVCEGLTSTQVEKIKSLAESVEFSTEEEYQEKLETIRENYFPSGMKKANASQMHEQVEDGSEKPAIKDARMAAYASAISKTLPK